MTKTHSRSPSPPEPSRDRRLALVLANVVILGVWLTAAWIQSADRDVYYRSVQEDETLEWATFWAFMLAAGAFAFLALRRRGAGKAGTWFLAGVGVFCFVVAMEEISWAQRVLGFRPPVYFLENNFQQELNLHNVVSTDLRKLAVPTILLTFGLVLPLAARFSGLRRHLERLGIVPPSLGLAPAFVGAYFLYESYPWSHTGEWVEMMMGLGFLFAALVSLRKPWVPVLAATLLVLVLGWGSASATRSGRADHPGLVDAAERETEVLRRDFVNGRLKLKCGVHKRLYSYVQKYDQDYLFEGEFSQLTRQGLPEERAAFFLDPWNSPYWIRSKCSKDRQKESVFIYSFGPNRRRDSDDWDIHGDDIGSFLRRR